MKEKILDYIKRNPGADLHMISGEINEDERIVLKAINDLLKNGLIGLCSLAPIDSDNSSSCRYKVLKMGLTKK